MNIKIFEEPFSSFASFNHNSTVRTLLDLNQDWNIIVNMWLDTWSLCSVMGIFKNRLSSPTRHTMPVLYVYSRSHSTAAFFSSSMKKLVSLEKRSRGILSHKSTDKNLVRDNKFCLINLIICRHPYLNLWWMKKAAI